MSFLDMSIPLVRRGRFLVRLCLNRSWPRPGTIGHNGGCICHFRQTSLYETLNQNWKRHVETEANGLTDPLYIFLKSRGEQGVSEIDESRLCALERISEQHFKKIHNFK